MWFEKRSVDTRISNHRLIELQKSLNLKRNDTRFQKPSYLYATSRVCVFCSQFFARSIDEKVFKNFLLFLHNFHFSFQLRNSSQDDLNFSLEKKDSIILPPTNVNRQDIAAGHRCYQSSEVDNMPASNALLPPYNISSKTRLELEPWWEMDLGKGRNAYSVIFQIPLKMHQEFILSVIILERPTGFLCPRLDKYVISLH